MSSSIGPKFLNFLFHRLHNETASSLSSSIISGNGWWVFVVLKFNLFTTDYGFSSLASSDQPPVFAQAVVWTCLLCRLYKNKHLVNAHDVGIASLPKTMTSDMAEHEVVWICSVCALKCGVNWRKSWRWFSQPGFHMVIIRCKCVHSRFNTLTDYSFRQIILQRNLKFSPPLNFFFLDD